MRVLSLMWIAIAVVPARLSGREFQNLDFEQAMVPPTAAGLAGGPVDPALAFPGWTMGLDGTQAYNFTGYNTLTLGSVAQVLVGPSYPNRLGLMPLEGSYSALLQFGLSQEAGIPALIQTGVIPADVRSITFLAPTIGNDARVTVDGVTISLMAIGDRLTGDVSAFANREVELMFSTNSYNGNWLYFDDVTFSPAPAPEPDATWLVACGVFVLQFAGARRSHRTQSHGVSAQ